MSRGPISKEQHEPELSKTVELAELDGCIPGGVLQYFDMRKHEEKKISTCPGDIYVICNALMDYANLLEGVIEEWELTGFHATYYELHAARCRKISKKYADAIGYNYEKAMAKCQKRRSKRNDDFGQDALVAFARKSEQQAKEAVGHKKEGSPSRADG
jgi:hypothetical protein